MPTREELLKAAASLERIVARGVPTDDAQALANVATWLREQAEQVNDVEVS